MKTEARDPSPGSGVRQFTGGTTIKVLVVDDHALFREGLKLLLEGLENVTVVGEADDGQEALRLIGEQHPDVALMDISMPGMSGLTAAARAATVFPGTRVIMLSMH